VLAIDSVVKQPDASHRSAWIESTMHAGPVVPAYDLQITSMIGKTTPPQ
jgi:hypothetical protein